MINTGDSETLHPKKHTERVQNFVIDDSINKSYTFSHPRNYWHPIAIFHGILRPSFLCGMDPSLVIPRVWVITTETFDPEACDAT